MTKLLLCPFCGGEIKTAVITFDEKFYEPPYEMWYLEHADIVAASEEHCPIPTTDTFYDTETEAIEAWNTRAKCENCAALNKAAGLWAKANAEKRNRDESIHNLIKLLDKRQELIEALESLVRDMYGAWCATIDDYYEQRIDGYYERMTELGIEVRG